MQYKKDNVRRRIIEVGKEEYLENGFRGGNIKTIAEKAGVPVGNLYRYFDGKSGLLDAIVSPVYNEIPSIIDKLAHLFISQNLTFGEFVPVLADSTLQILDMYKAELLILVYRCEKTKYGDFIDKIVVIISSLIMNYMHGEPTADQKEFVAIISKSFITTLFDLIRDGYERERLKELINKLIEFTFFNINDRI
ncbi:MAG: TetR/AcrR family transcriptional regulator [Clostridiales bacterium]|nr:TetR/AcrR family transcriptional regulator [Clostridiales bacterium]